MRHTSLIRLPEFRSFKHGPDAHVPAGHKCARLHWHSFRIEIHVTGEPDPQLGWVMDFADLKTAFAPLYDQLDHTTSTTSRGWRI